jgi:hypothetical protein
MNKENINAIDEALDNAEEMLKHLHKINPDAFNPLTMRIYKSGLDDFASLLTNLGDLRLNLAKEF